MTSPYITFEEMEEGVPHTAIVRENGRILPNIYRRSGSRVETVNYSGDWDYIVRAENVAYAPIPAYSPPNSWDDMRRGDYLYVNGGFSQSDRNYWFRDDVLLRCSDEEWEAAGDYRKHLRKKAGGS